MTGPDNLDDLVLTIQNFNSTFEGTYVCRTENVAGVDADVVSLVTGKPIATTTRRVLVRSLMTVLFIGLLGQTVNLVIALVNLVLCPVL